MKLLLKYRIFAIGSFHLPSAVILEKAFIATFSRISEVFSPSFSFNHYIFLFKINLFLRDITINFVQLLLRVAYVFFYRACSTCLSLHVQVMKLYMNKLTPYEHHEIFNYPQIYFIGANAKKRPGIIGGPNNCGYDDDQVIFASFSNRS